MATSTTSAGTKTTMCLTSLHKFVAGPLSSFAAGAGLSSFAAGPLSSSSSMEGSTVSPGLGDRPGVQRVPVHGRPVCGQRPVLGLLRGPVFGQWPVVGHGRRL